MCYLIKDLKNSSKFCSFKNIFLKTMNAGEQFSSYIFDISEFSTNRKIIL